MLRKDSREELMDAKRDRIKVHAGDILHFDTWGGGGWGKPFERDAELVAKDVDRGLVSIAGALRYGVVMSDSTTFDVAATQSLRDKMRIEDASRKDVFNRGGTVDELKARCLAETGLEPPVQPIFQLRKGG